ncbi:GMC oxidoreductase [Hysterangium stoloniferum]|nr:GMC oxidoreductase [Hysterangium stoloniferum]
MTDTTPQPLITDPSVVATSGDIDPAAPLVGIQHNYDYIIVGGGTAGCVLAYRLSEDPNVTVLVVESGGNNEDQLFSKIPTLFSKMFKSDADWAYYTEPQEALDNRKLFWPRGKLLGGSSSMNAMMFTEGAPSDYEQWVRLGAKGWGYSDIKPYLRKVEGHVPHTQHPNPFQEYRGDNGLVKTGFSHCAPVVRDYLKASAKNGVEYNPDLNTGTNALGGTEIMSFIDDKGHRSSAATAFLNAETLARPNLRVLINATVTRVLFTSGTKPRAAGIEIATGPADAARYRAAANKEVILCAGAIGTPQLLLLSGIGPREQLEKLGIKVVIDQKWVGENLSDHPSTGSISFRAKPGTTLDYLNEPDGAGPALQEWLEKGTGVLTSNVAETAIFIRSTDTKRHPFSSKANELNVVKDATSGPDAPDVEMIGAGIAFLEHGFQTGPAGSNFFTIFPILLRPSSVGYLKLRSANPWDKPYIDPKCYSHPNDMAVMVRAIRLALRIARSEPLADKLDLKPHSTDKQDVFWPGDADPDVITDSEIAAFIRRNAETNYHPVGTAKIGASASEGVVDPKLCVYGVEGLRVMDASVFPNQMSGHPTSIILAMAYRAADIIQGKI